MVELFLLAVLIISFSGGFLFLMFKDIKCAFLEIVDYFKMRYGKDE